MKKFFVKIGVIIIICILHFQIISNANNIGDSGEVLRNPDRGFYKLVQVQLKNDDKEDINKFKKQVENITKEDPDVSIISFQLNLIEFVPKEDEINAKKIKEVNQYFSIMRDNGYQVIFRVVYDSEGKENPEPSFQTILKHIEQLKDVYVQNEDVILLVEAGYLGSYGEWHSGKYDEDVNKKNQIIDKLLQVIPESIQINLRRPKFIQEYIGSLDTVNSSNAYTAEKIARLGLHNDGYLASDTDLGTYSRNEREESLRWQEKQTLYTLFGGESQNKDSIFTNIENAISDMRKRHCVYLNKTYDTNVKEKWKNTKYNNENGYKYIQNHLGYRLILEEMNISQKGNKLNIDVQIKNVGFGNIVRKKKTSLILKSQNEQYEIILDMDIREKLNEDTYSFNLQEKLPNNIKNDTYSAYLKISEPYEKIQNNVKYSIRLANSNIYDEILGANYLGDIKITSQENNNIIIKIIIIAIIIIVITIIIMFVTKRTGKEKMS